MGAEDPITTGQLSLAAIREPHDLPAELPRPRGPMTAALLDCLRRDPGSTRVNPARLSWSGPTAAAATDHDLQLALWLAYELPFRGLAGVDDAWEWHPGLVEVVEEWEGLLLDALISVTAAISVDSDPASSPEVTASTREQFRELLIHRSVYYLKEAESQTWGVPATQDGDPQHFRSSLGEWGLSTRYGHYLDCVPGITLLTGNMMSLFGRGRRFRAALVGDRCAAYANKEFAAWVLPRWAAGQSSLLDAFGQDGD